MEKTVFTNGCFDILHPGHIDLLEKARSLGTRLVVGINSDASVRAIKGPERPVLRESERAALLSALRAVDEVRVFDEPTPERLIREIAPDVLVKGGDWPVDRIVGAEFVIGRGGEVHSIPLTDGFSSTNIVEKVLAAHAKEGAGEPSAAAEGDRFDVSVEQHLATFARIRAELGDVVRATAELIWQAFAAGNKVLICGNGGSAADAQHLAAEFVGRYETERRGLPSIALTTDTSALTALANDYSFERVFARQVEALARPGDVLVAITTSGNSPNVLNAVMAARNLGCKVVGLTGAKGKTLAALCDACVMIPATRTARVQEGHITVAHIWCEYIDDRVAAEAQGK